MDLVTHPYPGTRIHFEDEGSYTEKLAIVRWIRSDQDEVATRGIRDALAIEFNRPGMDRIDLTQDGLAGTDLCAHVGARVGRREPIDMGLAVACLVRSLETWYDGYGELDRDLILAGHLVEQGNSWPGDIDSSQRLQIVQAAARLPWHDLARHLVKEVIKGAWEPVTGRSDRYSIV